MNKLLVLIIFLSLAGLIYFKLTGFRLFSVDSSLGERVTTLENVVASMRASLADTKSPQNIFPKPTVSDLETRISVLEKEVTSLKSQKVSGSTSLSGTKPPVYIPLGTGGSSFDQNWVLLGTYQVSLDTSEYPGYTGVILEVNMKLSQASGNGYVRLYNSTDKTVVSPEVKSASSDQYSWYSSGNFTLPEGKKVYQLQLKSPTGTEVYMQNARLKIFF